MRTQVNRLMWKVWAVSMLAAGGAAVHLAQRPDMAPAIARLASLAEPLQAVDGDTVKRGKIRTRLMKYDTPEIGRRAKCPEEHELGLRAKARLDGLLMGSRWQMVYSKRRDVHGRDLALLTVDGQDVAAIMIAEGLARPYTGRKKRRGWCGADITP